jgi:hypothetical protein
MKKIISLKGIAFILILYTAPFSSCSKDESAKSPLLDHIGGMSSIKSGEDCSPYYTDATVSAAKKYAAKYNDTEILAGLDRKIFVKGSQYSILSEKRDGDSAVITLKIIKHPSPNMIGYETLLNMKFEDNKWKIDRRKEIDALLK